MAIGKYAWAICDQCGFRYKYLDLKETSYGTRVCRSCHDGGYDIMNHPQNFPANAALDDESLDDPRPDKVFTSIDA